MGDSFCVIHARNVVVDLWLRAGLASGFVLWLDPIALERLPAACAAHGQRLVHRDASLYSFGAHACQGGFGQC